MRVPKGAPSAGLLYWQQKFPFLKQFKTPPLGTLAVVGCVSFTVLGIGVMILQPYIYNDYYKEVQAQKRALITASREELAQGMKPCEVSSDEEVIEQNQEQEDAEETKTQKGAG
ncbi:unnamed protein product [Bursaphelenchus okinawaensis]|uniref:Uncharacterized protein n=1 Tax=Bursaphelenchus okinawaensis TaxID=465554 RepID=A0A811K9N9_9BILA|nr:unnamed protein product [Bursaphelenchus okinawaensis]CAG9095271.1 unnamed protein product [Bursaphelenchus okinawaensis]